MIFILLFFWKMKKNLVLMLSLATLICLAGCGQQNVENSDMVDQESEVVANEDVVEVETDRSSWVATSLTIEDLERIEESMAPMSYSYSTYNMTDGSIIDSWNVTAQEGEDNKFSIPEYENMVNREIVSSGIEDDMIYTLANVTLEDGSVLQILYVNEPDTLFCRAISAQNGDQTTLYSNFVYAADVE